MTINWRTATGLTGTADTASPFANITHTLPTGNTTNDLLIAIYGGKPDTTTASTPTDYTACGSVADASGSSFGNGTGQNRAQAFYKVHDGSESAPAHTFSAQYSPGMVAMLAAYSSDNPGSGWDVDYTTGSDNSSTGTSVSAAGAGSLDFRVGDKIVIISVGCDNLTTESSASVSSTGGVTFDTLSEVLGTNTTTQGNDGSMYVYEATCTAAGTGTPTFTATSGGTNLSHRAVVFLRVREPQNTSGTLTATWSASGTLESATTETTDGTLTATVAAGSDVTAAVGSSGTAPVAESTAAVWYAELQTDPIDTV